MASEITLNMAGRMIGISLSKALVKAVSSSLLFRSILSSSIINERSSRSGGILSRFIAVMSKVPLRWTISRSLSV